MTFEVSPSLAPCRRIRRRVRWSSSRWSCVGSSQVIELCANRTQEAHQYLPKYTFLYSSHNTVLQRIA